MASDGAADVAPCRRGCRKALRQPGAHPTVSPSPRSDRIPDGAAHASSRAPATGPSATELPRKSPVGVGKRSGRCGAPCTGRSACRLAPPGRGDACCVVSSASVMSPAPPSRLEVPSDGRGSPRSRARSRSSSRSRRPRSRCRRRSSRSTRLDKLKSFSSSSSSMMSSSSSLHQRRKSLAECSSRMASLQQPGSTRCADSRCMPCLW